MFEQIYKNNKKCPRCGNPMKENPIKHLWFCPTCLYEDESSDVDRNAFGGLPLFRF